MTRRDHRPRRPAWIPAAIVAAAAALRLAGLGKVPPGFQFDEAHNAIDAAWIVAGARPLFLADNGGREALLSYLHAALLGGLGLDHPVLALRLTSAFVGTVTVAAVLVLVGRFSGDRGLGRLTAAVLAGLYAHLHFSRYGIRTIVAPLWATLVVAAWWAATAGAPSRRARLALAAACGAALAGAVWSHPTGRLLPLVVVGHAAWRAAASRGRTVAGDASALAVAGATALALFAPLGLHFARYPALFTGHASDVGLAAVAAAHHDGRIGAALAAQLAAVAGMFFVAGDPSTLHNLPGRPLFDPLAATAFVLGLGLAAGALVGRGPGAAARRSRAVLGALWLAVGLAPTVLSDRAPNFSRTTAALPVVALVAALGLRAAAGAAGAWLARRRGADGRAAARWAGGLAAAAVALAAAWTARDYFGAFARDPQVPYSYDVDKLDALAALRARAADASVFLAPVWAGQATIDYLNRVAPQAAERRASAALLADVGDPAYEGRIFDASGDVGGDGDAPPRIGRLDATRTLVYPDDGRDVVVAMPSRDADKVDWADEVRATFAGAPIAAETVDDARGRPLLALLRVPAAAFGDLAPPTDAPLEPAVWTHVRFGGAAELLGYTAGAARPGEPLPLTLWWRAQEPLPENWTVFVHLLGAGDAPLGQDDREPGQASYRTSEWLGGEVIVDQHRPRLDPAAADEVRVCLGWYDVATGRRLTTSDGQDAFCGRPLRVEGR